MQEAGHRKAAGQNTGTEQIYRTRNRKHGGDEVQIQTLEGTVQDWQRQSDQPLSLDSLLSILLYCFLLCAVGLNEGTKEQM